MTEVVPSILRDYHFDVWDASYSMRPGDSIYDTIVGAIRRADLIVSDVSITNANVSYELGIAHAWGTPSLLITRDLDRVPFDVATRYQLITYGDTPESYERFYLQFTKAVVRFIERRAPKLPKIFDRYLSRRDSIRLELFDAGSPSVEIFALIADLTEAIDRIEDISDSRLAEVRVGSFGAWVTANFEKVLSLAEKIIFFVPETRKKWHEGTKFKEEAEFIRAQKAKVDAEAEWIRDENHRQNVDKFLDVVERLGEHGEFRVSFGDRLQISSASTRPLIFDKPADTENEDVESGRRE